MKRAEKNAMQSVAALVDALSEAQQAFRKAEQSYQRALTKADRTGQVVSALLSSQLGDVRESVNDAVDQVEERRRDMRLKLFALAMAEDYSISEVARLFGFSRQLASRYASELRTGKH